jgi:hypothetical protein
LEQKLLALMEVSDEVLQEWEIGGEKTVHVPGYYLTTITSKVTKDLHKVEFSTENFESTETSWDTFKGLLGFRTLDNGLTYLGCAAGGDWETPLFFMIYWNGKALRGYIPLYGNPWNTENNEAYGNDDVSDRRNVYSRFGVDDPDDIQVNVKTIHHGLNAYIRFDDSKGGAAPKKKDEAQYLIKEPAPRYIIVKHPNDESLESMVNKYIDQGYEPLGGLVQNRTGIYMQTVQIPSHIK